MERYEHGGDIYGTQNVSVDFSVNLNPLGAPRSVRDAFVAHVSDFARYPDPQCRELRHMLAEKSGITAESILCGNGASELIFALCACVKPQSILIPSPTFSEYERAATLYGASAREYQLSETQGFTVTDDILAALLPPPDILFLCNPNNPTGRLTDPTLMHEIAATCRDNGTLLVLDECFIDFTDGISMLGWLADYPNLLVLRAFTKIYAMAGLRLGVLYGEKALIARIAAFCPPWNVSSVAQAVGIAALRENEWAEHTRRFVEAERIFMSEALAEMGLTVIPSDANFLLIKSNKPLDKPLLHQGILVRSCANFPGLDGSYIRIGLKTREENTALIHAISEVLHG